MLRMVKGFFRNEDLRAAILDEPLIGETVGNKDGIKGIQSRLHLSII